MRIPRVLPLLLALLLCACVYRPEIKQGNFIDDSMIARIKPDMTEAQVQLILGPPMIRDPFHADRWDYVYYFEPSDRSSVATRHVVVLFKDGKVVSIAQKPMQAQKGP